MILQRSHGESWVEAAQRYGEYLGYSAHSVANRMAELLLEGYSERRAAYLTLAGAGVDGAE